MQVQIIFIASGSSSVTGNFAPGDTLRCSVEQARHYVEDARCARYADGAAPTADARAGATTKISKRKTGAKEQA